MESNIMDVIAFLDEKEKKRIIEYDSLYSRVREQVDKDIKNVKSDSDVIRIKSYLEWLIDWMNNDLHINSDYLLRKSAAIALRNKIFEAKEKFSDEGITKQLDKFIQDVKNKSEQYRRWNEEDE